MRRKPSKVRKLQRRREERAKNPPVTKRRLSILTEIARDRHKAGRKKLREAFGGEAVIAHMVTTSGPQHGATKLFRRKPGVQVLRDGWHQRRHRRKKAARAARKRNRR